MKRVIVLLILLCSVSLVVAEANLTQQQKAEICLNESVVAIQSLSSYNISVVRFNDSLTKAQDLYNAQIIIESKKGRTNYETTISYCDQISSLKRVAVEAIDSRRVFLSFYKDTIDPNMNTLSVDDIISQIDAEIAGERYENVAALIDQGYNEISKIKSEQTALALAYSVAAKGIGGFIVSNWVWLVSVIVFLLVFYTLYRVKIALWLLNRKMMSLLLRKDTLKKLMSEAQKDYFQFGKIPESEYRIKIKNFGELVRDIDRQIPLIQQDIARFSFALKEKQAKQKDEERAKRIK
jgi:hypothetical protein